MDLRATLQRLVVREADALSALFYRELMADPATEQLLETDVVQRRLHASLARWLKELFDERTPADQLLTSQRHAGQVHARIGVPHAAIGAGARLLKRRIVDLWREGEATVDAPAAAHAVQYVYELVDLAVDTMGAAAQTDAARITRADEGYRLFVLTQNLRTERERQKTQLLEWARRLLLRHYWELPMTAGGPTDVPGRDETGAASVSQFELWVKHKAAMLFDAAPELAEIRSGMAEIQRGLLPRLRQARRQQADARELVAELERRIDRMKDLLGTLFDRAADHETGRDELTRLLNRRYLPAIVKREIALAQAGAQTFSLLLLDLDHFDAVAQALGRAGADRVLAEVAAALNDSVRAGDFVFRLDQHQFLVLAVETDTAAASAMAEGLRLRLGGLALSGTGALTPRLTVSVGVAVHDGHPDYERQLQRAEEALRAARRLGRDQVVIAKPSA